jgi:hypothetical protein
MSIYMCLAILMFLFAVWLGLMEARASDAKPEGVKNDGRRDDLVQKKYHDPHKDVPPKTAVERNGKWEWE